LRSNRTLDLIRKGDVALGTWIELHNLYATRLLAAQGCFQWMLIDAEHSPVESGTIATLCAMMSDISQGLITPLVRVATGTIDHIKQALDCGAQGIIAPMINTKEEAANVVKFAKYPPEGQRGIGGLFPHIGYGVKRRPEYLERANQETLVGIQIETREGADNISEILDVKGIDFIFIGPNDLHQSLGLNPQFWSEEPLFQAYVQKIITACQDRGIPYGTLCPSAAQAKDRKGDGFTFLGLGSDTSFLLSSAGKQYSDFYNLPEPPEGWRSVVNLHRLQESTLGKCL